MIRPRLTLLALAIPLALAGCALGPDYQRPDARVALPESYANAAAASDPTTAPAVDSRWWNLFGDAQLTALVDQALASSPDALTAAARIEEADAVLRQVDAALLPQIDANAGVSRSRTILPNAVEPTGLLRNTNKIGLSTSFELDVWGRLRRASEAARAQALGTRYASETVSLSLAASVTQAYLNLRAIDAQLLVNRDSVSSQARSTQLARVRGTIEAGCPNNTGRHHIPEVSTRMCPVKTRNQSSCASLGVSISRIGATFATASSRDSRSFVALRIIPCKVRLQPGKPLL